ncbi:hypothetical protein NFI96_030991, partial [Prochilodus magdalenae]
MGGNSSSRLDSLEADDAEGFTVVKGIRLTDRVIDRMKESPQAVSQHPQSKSQACPPVAQPAAPLGQPCCPGEPISPHPPSYASSLVPPLLQEPVPPPVPPASVTQENPTPGDSFTPTVEALSPLSPAESSAQEHITTPPPTEPVSITPSPPTESLTTTASPGEAVFRSPSTSSTEPTEPVATTLEKLVPPQPSSVLAVPSEPPSTGQMGPPPIEETSAPPSFDCTKESTVAPVLPPFAETISPLASPPKTQAAVKEEELRKQIRDEMQRQLQEEMMKAELKIQQQLEEEKAKAEAEAQAKARLQIEAEVQRVLEREQIALQQSLKDAVMKERMNTENERLVAQHYVRHTEVIAAAQYMHVWVSIQKLEEKERDLAKQDSLYREQITKLEEKTAQFTRVTAESFKKALDDTHNRFKRYQIKPACSELQSEVLKCYKENTGQTLTCSNIASLYMQCVDEAK